MAQAPPLMDLRVMRALIKRSAKTPVNCAIGVGPDGAVLILLHRRKPPKALEKELKKAVPEAKGTRWGTASVDPESDPKLVKLVLNKAAAGMARRLVRTLKGTGYNKVEVSTE